MPTYDKTAPFLNDWDDLSSSERELFRIAVRKFVADLRAGKGFRKGLRVRRVQDSPGVYEMTWAPDGRATFEYGPPVRPGDVHIRWRRCGTHAIFQDP